MRDFGEALCVYSRRSTPAQHTGMGSGNGNAEIALNFMTPHQKWGIH